MGTNNMGYPGTTRAYSGSNTWQLLLTGLAVEKLQSGGATANGFHISVHTNAVQYAFGDAVPLTQGHVLQVEDTLTFLGIGAIERLYLKNNTSGSTAVIVVTPLLMVG